MKFHVFPNLFYSGTICVYINGRKNAVNNAIKKAQWIYHISSKQIGLVFCY